MSTSPPLLLTQSDFLLIKENLLEGGVMSKGLCLAINLTPVTPAAEWSHLLQGKVAGSEGEDKWLPLCPSLHRTMAARSSLQARVCSAEATSRHLWGLRCSGLLGGPSGSSYRWEGHKSSCLCTGRSLDLSLFMRAELASKWKANQINNERRKYYKTEGNLLWANINWNEKWIVKLSV